MATTSQNPILWLPWRNVCMLEMITPVLVADSSIPNKWYRHDRNYCMDVTSGLSHFSSSLFSLVLWFFSIALKSQSCTYAIRVISMTTNHDFTSKEAKKFWKQKQAIKHNMSALSGFILMPSPFLVLLSLNPYLLQKWICLLNPLRHIASLVSLQHLIPSIFVTRGVKYSSFP